MIPHGQDEETLVRKRLLYQSTTTRGEPPFKRLAQKFVQLSKELQAEPRGPTQELAAGFFQELSGIESMGHKLLAVQEANLREQKSYKLQQAQLEGSKTKARAEIEVKKAELVQARIKRAQNEEYEMLRDTCMALQRRSKTNESIQRLQENIEAIEASTRELTQAEELQKKRFAVLSHYMSQLEGEIEEEAAGGGDDSSPATAEPSQS